MPGDVLSANPDTSQLLNSEDNVFRPWNETEFKIENTTETSGRTSYYLSGSLSSIKSKSLKIELPTALSYTSDISYWVEPYYALNIPEHWALEVNITLTCSISGDTNIDHYLTRHGNEPVPQWVTLNTEAK